MAKTKVSSSTGSTRKIRPGLSPENEESQMISLAIDLAKKQLQEGTASSQVITHYLKLGSTTARIEKQILEKQKELIEAKTQQLYNLDDEKELLEKAMKAFTSYQGRGEPDEY